MREIRGPVLLRAAAGAGLALVAMAVAWWAVVYAQVIGTTGITAEEYAELPALHVRSLLARHGALRQSAFPRDQALFRELFSGLARR